MNSEQVAKVRRDATRTLISPAETKAASKPVSAQRATGVCDPDLPPVGGLAEQLRGGSRVDGGKSIGVNSPLFARGEAEAERPLVDAAAMQVALRLSSVPEAELGAAIAALPPETLPHAQALLLAAGGKGKLATALSAMAKGYGSPLALREALYAARGDKPPATTSSADLAALTHHLLLDDVRVPGGSAAKVDTGHDALGPFVKVGLDGVLDQADTRQRVRTAMSRMLPADARVVFTLADAVIAQAVGPKNAIFAAGEDKAILATIAKTGIDGLQGKDKSAARQAATTIESIGTLALELETSATSLSPLEPGALRLSATVDDRLVYATRGPEGGAWVGSWVDITRPHPHAMSRRFDAPDVAPRSDLERATELVQARLQGSPEAPRRMGDTNYWVDKLHVEGGRLKIHLKGGYGFEGKADFRDMTLRNIAGEFNNTLNQWGLRVGADITADLKNFPPGGRTSFEPSPHPISMGQAAAASLSPYATSRTVQGHPGVTAKALFRGEGDGIEATIYLWIEPRIFRGDSRQAAQAALAQVETFTREKLAHGGFGGVAVELTAKWQGEQPAAAEDVVKPKPAKVSDQTRDTLSQVKTLGDWKALSAEARRDVFDDLYYGGGLPKGFTTSGKVPIDELAKLDPKLAKFAKTVVGDLAGDGPEVSGDHVTIGPIQGTVEILRLPGGAIAGARVDLEQPIAFDEVGTGEYHFDSEDAALEAGIELGSERYQREGWYDGDLKLFEEQEWAYDH